MPKRVEIKLQLKSPSTESSESSTGSTPSTIRYDSDVRLSVGVDLRDFQPRRGMEGISDLRISSAGGNSSGGGVLGSVVGDVLGEGRGVLGVFVGHFDGFAVNSLERRRQRFSVVWG